MAVIEEGVENVIATLPPEMATQISSLLFYLKAIGGIFILYLIFLLVRTYFTRRQTKMFKEMSKDIKKIKRKLKIKN